jgi:hypothetical protein
LRACFALHLGFYNPFYVQLDLIMIDEIIAVVLFGAAIVAACFL